MNKEECKELARLDKELSIIYHKMGVIEAKYKKAIWMDKAFDKDRKDTLHQAELTLRLSEDKEHQSLLEQTWDIETRQKELGSIPELDGNSLL